MPKVAQTVEPTVATELTEKQQARLLLELVTYRGLYIQAQELKEMLEVSKGQLEAIRQEVGDRTIELEGFGSATDVSGGTTRTLDKKKVYALGVTPKMLETCYVERPKKGHLLVTVPGVKTHTKDEE